MNCLRSIKIVLDGKRKKGDVSENEKVSSGRESGVLYTDVKRANLLIDPLTY
jgi:hypothetical protein